MDRQAAEHIIPMLVRAAAEVAATIDIVQAQATKEQVKAYADAVGEVVLAIDGVMRPIVNEYPDLHP